MDRLLHPDRREGEVTERQRPRSTGADARQTCPSGKKGKSASGFEPSVPSASRHAFKSALILHDFDLFFNKDLCWDGAAICRSVITLKSPSDMPNLNTELFYPLMTEREQRRDHE